MSNAWHDVLVGTGKYATMGELEDAIEGYQQELQSAKDDPERERILEEIRNLEGLRAYYEEQGLVDADGRLVKVKDVADEYIDQDYLDQIKENQADALSQNTGQVYQELRRQQLKGDTSAMPGEVSSIVESLSAEDEKEYQDAYLDQKNLAYTKGSSELGRGEQYATNLAADERALLELQLSALLQEQATQLGLSEAEINALQAKVESMPDGLVQQMLVAGSGLAGQWIMGNLSGG